MTYPKIKEKKKPSIRRPPTNQTSPVPHLRKARKKEEHVRTNSTRPTRTKLDRKQEKGNTRFVSNPVNQPLGQITLAEGEEEGTRAYQGVRGPGENECLLTSWKLKILRGLCGAISRANIHWGTTGAQCPSALTLSRVEGG